jgi:hypothetical protein
VPEDRKADRHARLRDLEAGAAKADVALIGVVRDGRRRYGTGPQPEARAGDALVIEADPAALDEFRAAQTSNPQGRQRRGRRGRRGDAGRGGGARRRAHRGQDGESIGLAWRQNTTLMGIARQGRRITKSLRKTVIEPGDILLLLAPSDRAEDVVSWLGGMTLADRGLAVTQETKTWTAIAVFAGAVAGRAGADLPARRARGSSRWLRRHAHRAAVGALRRHRMARRRSAGLHDPARRALETSGGTALIADGLVTLTEGLARLGDPDGPDGGDDDAVGHPQQHGDGNRGGARRR